VPLDDEQVAARLDQIRTRVELITIFRRDTPSGLRGGYLFALIAADDAHAQLGPLLESGVEISTPESAVFPDRRDDELAWLRNCWAPEIRDAEALARLHEVLAASPEPVAEPWREVGRVTVAIAELRKLEVETRIRLSPGRVPRAQQRLGLPHPRLRGRADLC
jgi:hypothetical protein